MIETIYTLPEIDNGRINTAYIGKPNTCMCGCAGTYYYTKDGQVKSGEERGYKVTDDEVNDKKVQKIIKKIRKNEKLGIEVIENYIYTVIIGNKRYSLYLFK
jgi:hypothetical protein